MSRVVTVPELLDGHTVLDIECLDRIYLFIILSPAAGRVADLGGRVEDAVLDAALVVRGSLSAVA